MRACSWKVCSETPKTKSLHGVYPWRLNFLSPCAVLVVWVDAQKPAANESLRASVAKRGFVIVHGTGQECGCVLLARRSQAYPVEDFYSEVPPSLWGPHRPL